MDALLCGECGVYVASLLAADDGLAVATLNVAGVALAGFEGRTPDPISYDDETDAAKLARRQARWTPTVLVETSPSA